MSFHSRLVGGDIHTLVAFEYANAGARTSATGLVEGDVGKMAIQLSDRTFWMLGTISPLTWDSMGGDPGAANAAYSLAAHADALAVAGTTAANSADQWGRNAFSLAVSGTNAAQAASTIAGEAFTLATVGTNAAQAANIIAGEAYTLAVVGTNAAQAANVIAGEAFTLATVGTNAAQAASTIAGEAFTLATVGTNAAQAANIIAGEAYTLAIAGTAAAALNGTSAGAANTATAAVAGSAYSLAATGTYTEAADFACDDFQGYSIGQTTGFTGGTGWTNNGTATGCVIISQAMPFGNAVQKLQIANGEYIRQFAWGSRWRKIRIGVSVRINPVTMASFNYSSPLWTMGICSGNKGYKSTTTDNMVFCGLNQAFFPATQAVTFTRGVSSDYFNTNGGNNIATRRGSTDSNNASGIGRGMFAANGTSHGLILGFEVSRASFVSTSYSLLCNAVDNSAPKAEGDMGLGALLQAFKTTIGDAMTMNGYSANSATGNSFTFDESTGALDSMSFFWADPANKVELSAMGAWKLY